MNKKHDCNDFINSIDVNCANNMQNPKLGDAMFDEDDLFAPPQVLLSKFIMMIACLLFMMIILMKLGLEECQL